MNNSENIPADEFIEIPSFDDSTLDFKNIPHAVRDYLKRVSQVPLLKPEEEKKLFEKLQTEKTLLENILSQLLNSNLLDSEHQEQLKQVFR